MKLHVLYVSIGIAATLLIIACAGNDSSRENLNETENELQKMASEAHENLNEAFLETRKEISEETAEIKEEAKILKEEIKENQIKPADSVINQYMTRLDDGIQNLEIKAREFENAAEKRKEQIKTEFDKLVVEVESSLERLKNELSEG